MTTTSRDLLARGFTPNEIARTISETAGGSASIARDVHSVAAAAQSSSAGIADAQRAATELATLSTNLQNLVARFKS